MIGKICKIQLIYDHFDKFGDNGLTLGDGLIDRLTVHWQGWITIDVWMCPGSKTKNKTQLTMKTLRLMITPRLQENCWFNLNDWRLLIDLHKPAHDTSHEIWAKLCWTYWPV